MIKNNCETLKIIVVGQSQVGKTSFVKRFIDKEKFDVQTQPTVGTDLT
jgi:GTPase SAR1 family protein